MMRGDGCGGKAVSITHVMRGFARGDVFKHDFEFREIAAQRDELRIDEHGFTVKQINIWRCHFAMHQQQQSFLLHGL